MAGLSSTVSSKPSLFKRVFLPVLFLFLLTAFLARLAFDKEFYGMLDAHFWKQLWRVGRVMEMAHQDYLYADKVSYDKLADSALDHVLDGLDRYSTFSSRQEYEDFNNQSRQRIVGIGVEIERRNGHIQVVKVYENSPAKNAGWLPWDRIIAVGNTSISDLSTLVISDLIKGPDNTTVSITRERNGVISQGTLTRGGFDVPNIRDSEMLDHNVGYIRITQFGEKTGEEFSHAMIGLMGGPDGAMRGLILDLRDNPGGLVDAAIDVLEPLLPPGTLVMTTRGRNGELISSTYTQGRDVRFQGPVVVLVNENSASAAEIVAGALKDTHRAVILGSRTYGKGVIQSVFDLHDGTGLRLTTEAYFLPKGSSIQEIGITPDVPLPQSDEERDLQRLQRADLRYFRAEQLDPEQFGRTFGFAPVADAQVETAAGLVRAATPNFVR